MPQSRWILWSAILTGMVLFLAPTHMRAQVPPLPPPPPPSPCDRFALVPRWVGHFAISGTGSGEFADGSTYSVSESVIAAPQLRLGSSPSWVGSFNETIDIDDSLLQPDGTVDVRFTDHEKLLQGPITANVKAPGLPGLPGASLSVDLRACGYQFSFDPSFGSDIGQYGFVGLQPSGSLFLSMGNIQGPLPAKGLIIAGSATVSAFSALVGAPITWSVSWSFKPQLPIAAIDPGHGQVLATDGNLYYQRPPTHTYSLREDNLTLDMAGTTVDQLVVDGYEVFQTRAGVKAPYAPKGCNHIGPQGYGPNQACGIDLVKRVEQAQKWDAGVLVSIHTNANDNPTNGPFAHGTMSFWTSNIFQSIALCTNLTNDVSQLTQKNFGCSYQSLAILRGAWFPSSLVEIAFHSNWKLARGQTITDEDLLNDPTFRMNAAFATAKATNDFITNTIVGGH